MRAAALVVVGVLPLLTFPAASTTAAELTATLTVEPEFLTDHRASPYYVGPPTVALPHRGSRQDLELRLREGGFNAQGILRWEAAEGAKPEHHGVTNQFYYDGELAPGWGFTAGKKILGWGVGFGFKPLDVIQREDRRAVNPPALVGVPLLAVERFTTTDAWTLAWTRPGDGRGASDFRDESLALRWYRLAGGDDLHAVARVSGRRGLEAGFGGTRVIGEEWSLHGAGLYARRYRQRLNALTETGGTLAAADPMTETARRGGIKAVAGAQWTGASGLGVLVEAWYDGDAYSRAQWQRLDALTARQRAQAGVAPAAAIDGNVAWSSEAYLASNLLRENLLLRLSYDDGDGFRPYAELLATPADGGAVLTLGASLAANRQKFACGLRQLGGAADSAYARSPVRRLVWAEWRIALF